MRGVGLGAGYFSRFHYEAWSRMPEVQIVATCDVDPAKDTSYKNWREMIDQERPDFIDIITPPETHEDVCAYAANRGINIICQKPLAPTLDAAKRIVEITKNVRFLVHENWRWQPWYRRIKHIQQQGTIGDFTHIHFLMRMGDGWGPDAYLERQPFFRTYPKLLVYETGVHFIDTFRYLLGEVTDVYAHLRQLNPVIRGEDAGQIFLKFQSGATAIWDANRYNEVEAANPRYTFGTMRVDATKGHLTLDTDGSIRIKPLGEPAYNLDYDHPMTNFAGDCVYALQRHFVDCVLNDRPFESTGEDYLRTLEAVEKIYDLYPVAR